MSRTLRGLTVCLPCMDLSKFLVEDFANQVLDFLAVFIPGQFVFEFVSNRLFYTQRHK